MKSMVTAMNKSELLCHRVIALKSEVEEKNRMLELAKGAIPISIIQEEKKGKNGLPC